MMRILIALLFFTVATESFSQRTSDVYAAYIFGKLGGFDGTQDMVGTGLAGVNWYKKLSKKNYTVSSVQAVTGIRVTRSGYKMTGYSPYPDKAFFDKYGVSHIESSLMQHMVTVPVGFDFRFKPRPVNNPKSSFSVKITLNNSLMVYSKLKESVTYDESRTTNVTSYARKYVPGLTIETRMEIFLLGLTWQQVVYTVPANALNVNENAGSPFYEVFSKKGKYNDLYLYLGLRIPLKK